MIILVHIHVNFYMKWIYQFMSIWIHVCQFKCIDSEFLYKFMSIWISDIRIHCIQSEFMNLISLTWIHDMKSLLKINESSIFSIHTVEFSGELWIHSNELKQKINQISVMNSYMKWIFMNSQILFHGWIYGFI